MIIMLASDGLSTAKQDILWGQTRDSRCVYHCVRPGKVGRCGSWGHLYIAAGEADKPEGCEPPRVSASPLATQSGVAACEPRREGVSPLAAGCRGGAGVNRIIVIAIQRLWRATPCATTVKAIKYMVVRSLVLAAIVQLVDALAELRAKGIVGGSNPCCGLGLAKQIHFLYHAVLH